VAIWLLPLTTGKRSLEPAPEVIRLPLPANFETHSISALAFSPDGSRLAVGEGYWVHAYDLKAKVVTNSIQPASVPLRNPATTIVRLQFSKAGNRLLVGMGNSYDASGGYGPQVWDVRRPAHPGPGPEQPAAPLVSLKDSREPFVAWSADNEQFAVLRAGWQHDLLVWSADGTQQPRTTEQGQQLQRRLQAEFGTGRWSPNGGIHFRGKTDQVVAGVAGTVILLDPQTGKVERLHRGPAQVTWSFTTALSADGKLLAVTGDPAYEVILIDVETKKEVGRLGSPTPVPKFVGWGKDNRTIAWRVRLPPKGPRAAALAAGLNLATLEPWARTSASTCNPDNGTQAIGKCSARTSTRST
jgi:WD40 repeat protein